MHKVTLKKISGGSAIRTNIVIGSCYKLPNIGESFEMFAESLSIDGNTRHIVTSTVQNVQADKTGVTIETLNSKYKLEFN